jgi:ATP-dependent Zn protease
VRTETAGPGPTDPPGGRVDAVAALELPEVRVVRGDVDVTRFRERTRRRRLFKLFCFLAPFVAWMWFRIITGHAVRFGLPAVHLSDTQQQLVPGALLVLLFAVVLIVPLALAGKSPHIRYQPSEITVGFDDVVGLGPVKDEVVRTLNLFLTHQTFRDRMGGSPRRAMLFEGPPGTGKTYMAKAMAREAGVPFFFVSASSFQSMYYGQTNRKIRSFFKELRRAAREEGGAIGFIEEIDAIAGARSGMRAEPYEEAAIAPAGVHRSNTGEGISGVVNELLVQLQSFDVPRFSTRVKSGGIDWANRWLPAHRTIKKKPPESPNILVIGATNRAADLDPALLRPGRFDRSIHFDVPSKTGRREIIDYYLSRKAHEPELDKAERRDQLAAMTIGYSPVMLEHVLDEALIWSLRDERDAMSWNDVQQAKLTEEIGLKSPVEYTDRERETIATHEAGHAVVAFLEGGETHKLEVLSIIKRRESLGLLAHSDTEERWTRTRSELLVAIKIAFGGMTAEELFFGESGTGPSSDLAAATTVACRMVGSFGMAGSLVSFEAVENGPISAGIVGKVLSNEDARAAVERILESAKEEVRRLLDTHRNLIVALRDALLDRSELVGDEIIEVVREAQARHSATTP